MPYLLPLAKHHRLVFMDERGSGRSERLADFKGYTLDNLACDADAVRRALGLENRRCHGPLVRRNTGASLCDQVPSLDAATDSCRHRLERGAGQRGLHVIKDSLDPVLRARIDALELKGIIGADGAELPEYRKLADEAEHLMNTKDGHRNGTSMARPWMGCA